MENSKPLLLQLLLFIPGVLMMVLTGLWILPGLPFIFAIKALHGSSAAKKLQQSQPYHIASSFADKLAEKLLVDPRDKTLMVVSLGCALSSTALTVALAIQHLASPGVVHWPIVLVRQALMTATVTLAFTAKHQESHRGRRNTYKHPAAQATLQRINEWWTSTLYGNVPEIDRCGHGFVHHRNEMERDDWGNSHLDRANFWQFCQYAITAGLWHNSGVGLLVEFYQSGCWNLFRATAVGMAYYYISGAAVLAIGGPILFVLLYLWPFLANVGFGSVVNWSWHIFADPAEPLNYAASTITVLHWSGDVFNEGYHLTHHLRPAAHYLDVPQLYEDNRDYYIANNSLLLTESDPLGIWTASMLHHWGYFTNRLVDFSGQMTAAEKKAFVRYRTRPIGSQPANKLEASAVALAAAAAAKAAARMQATKVSGPTAVKPRRVGRQSTC